MGNFKVRQQGKPITNNYTLLDAGGKVVVGNMSMLEFALFIEGKGLEEAGEYTLVPAERTCVSS